MNNIRTIIFDFDGTITDSVNLWDDYINLEYFSSLNIEYNPNGEFSKKILPLKCNEIADLINDMTGSSLTGDEVKKGWLNISYKHFKNAKLKTGIKELIRLLYENKYRLAIASCNFSEIIKVFLQQNDLFEYFELIIGESDVSKIKPNPEAYLKVCQVLDINPKECLVFEDSVNGVLAAKSAGMKVIGIFDRESEKDVDLLKRLCDRFIYKYTEIIKVPNIDLAV